MLFTALQRTPARHQALLLRPLLRHQGAAAALHRLGRPVRFSVVRRPAQRRAAAQCPPVPPSPSQGAQRQRQQAAQRSPRLRTIAVVAVALGRRPDNDDDTQPAGQSASLGREGRHRRRRIADGARTATQSDEAPLNGGHAPPAADGAGAEQLVVGEHCDASDARPIDGG